MQNEIYLPMTALDLENDGLASVLQALNDHGGEVGRHAGIVGVATVASDGGYLADDVAAELRRLKIPFDYHEVYSDDSGREYMRAEVSRPSETGRGVGHFFRPLLSFDEVRVLKMLLDGEPVDSDSLRGVRSAVALGHFESLGSYLERLAGSPLESAKDALVTVRKLATGRVSTDVTQAPMAVIHAELRACCERHGIDEASLVEQGDQGERAYLLEWLASEYEPKAEVSTRPDFSEGNGYTGEDRDALIALKPGESYRIGPMGGHRVTRIC